MGSASDEHSEGFVSICPEWEKDTVANGTQICWLITTDSWYGRHRQKRHADGQTEKQIVTFLISVNARKPGHLILFREIISVHHEIHNVLHKLSW